MAAEWLTVRTGNGRDLEVLRDGPPDGRPLVFHSGTPSAAVEYPPLTHAAADRGWQLVTWSRPGYGTSTAYAGRSVSDVTTDTAAVLDHLGQDRFVTLGWSGGGPHALACAALMPDRCAAASSLAGVAPYPAEGLDWLAGMGTSRSRCPCGREHTTGWSRTSTAPGWPRTFRVSGFTSTTTRATCPS